MLTPVERIIFFLLATGSLYLAQRFFRQAARVIARGEGHLHVEEIPKRIWRAFEVTVTQRTVFRARLGTSLIHALIVWGFLVYFLVNAGDVLEGYVDVQFLGTGIVGNLYRLVSDVLSLLIIMGMVYFLVRRFVVRSPELAFHENIKLHSRVLSGLSRDSLIVGLFILIHVGSRFLGETFQIALRGSDSWQPFATAVSGLWDGRSHNQLEVSEHAMWWLALGTILAFIPYFPYTKHMHLFMGPLNYFSRPERTSLGALDPLNFEDEEREQFGAAKLEHLTRT